MGGKLTSGGIKLPNTGEVEQTKVVVSVDGFEADETGNIDIGGSFDYTSKTTQVGGLRSISRHGLRIYGIDDYLKKLDVTGHHLLLRDESLSMSRLNGEYVYIAEENELENESAFYRSDNGGLTYTREKLPTSNIQVMMTRVSETGEHVIITGSNSKVYLSSDYGKTFVELTTSVLSSNYVLSISRDGSKIVTSNIAGQSINSILRWENGSSNLVMLPPGIYFSNIVDIEIGDNRNIVFLTSANVLYSTTNNGSSWTSTSNVTSFGVNGDVTQIYYGTTDRKIKYRAISSSTFDDKLDLDTEYSNLDPDDAFIKSIKVSKDGTKISATILHTAHLTNFGTNPDKPATLIDDGTDTDGYQHREYNLNGLIFSEDSGQNWSLSKIKASGIHHLFLGGGDFQYNGFWRHVASDDLEKCFLAINSDVREMVKVTPKSIAAINTSNLIVDGGIVLGQSLETDTLWEQRLPGTLEYSPFYETFNLHMDGKFIALGSDLDSVDSSSVNDIVGKPLTITSNESSTSLGRIKVRPSRTIMGMDEIQTNETSSDSIKMPPHVSATSDAKVVQMTDGLITPSTIDISDLESVINLEPRVTALENIHVEVEVALATQQQVAAIPLSSTTNFSGMVGQEDGYFVGENYAIFYYAGGYTIKFHTMSQTGSVPIKITYLSGAGGGAGGYQGQLGDYQRAGSVGVASGGIENGFNGSDGGYSQVQYMSDTTGGWYSPLYNQGSNRPPIRHYRAIGTSITTSTLYGWAHASVQGTSVSSSTWPSQPPYNQYYNVYRPKQLSTVLTGEKMADGVEYLVYVGSGGNGGSGAGDNADWDGVGGSKGSGGAGGIRGAGSNGSKGGGDGGVDLGGSGGIAGGKSGATFMNGDGATSDIDITETQENKSLVGFGQVGANGATGNTTHWNGHSHKTTGGGGGGGGGSNGIVLIEWGEGI